MIFTSLEISICNIEVSLYKYCEYLHGASWVLENTRPLPSDLYTTAEESRLPLSNEVMPWQLVLMWLFSHISNDETKNFLVT